MARVNGRPSLTTIRQKLGMVESEKDPIIRGQKMAVLAGELVIHASGIQAPFRQNKLASAIKTAQQNMIKSQSLIVPKSKPAVRESIKAGRSGSNLTKLGRGLQGRTESFADWLTDGEGDVMLRDNLILAGARGLGVAMRKGGAILGRSGRSKKRVSTSTVEASREGASGMQAEAINPKADVDALTEVEAKREEAMQGEALSVEQQVEAVIKKKKIVEKLDELLKKSNDPASSSNLGLAEIILGAILGKRVAGKGGAVLRKLGIGFGRLAMAARVATPVGLAATGLYMGAKGIHALATDTGENASASFMPRGERAQRSKPASGSTKFNSNASYRHKAGEIDPSIADVIDRVSAQMGVDRATMYAIAQQESGFNPDAKARTSSATGLYQFLKGTWSDMVSKYGQEYPILKNGPRDPEANAVAGALYIKENSRVLSSIGVEPTAANLYALHFLGASGGKRFLSAPDSDLAANHISPGVANANSSVFTQGATVGQVKQRLFGKIAASATRYQAAFDEGKSGVEAVTGKAPVQEVAVAESRAVEPPSTRDVPKLEPRVVGRGARKAADRAQSMEATSEPTKQTIVVNPPVTVTPSSRPPEGSQARQPLPTRNPTSSLQATQMAESMRAL